MTRENLDVQRVLSSLIRKEAKQGEEALSAICYIEKVLKETYSHERYGSKLNTFETQRPLLIATLYKMIIARGGLPTVEEFIDNYIEESPQLSEERWLINAAYLSLVTDLHFYFVLTHSRLFDEVTIDYEFDLKAQTDIIVRKGDKLIGLQLFAGDIKSKQGKLLQLSQSSKALSYPLYLYSRQDRAELHEQLQTASGKSIVLYGERDAAYVLSLLEQQDEQASERFHAKLFDEPSQHFFVPTKPNQQMPTTGLVSDSFHQLLQQAKHSVLLFNDDSDEEARKQMTQAAIERGIHLYFYDVPPQQLPQELQHVSSIIDGQHNGAYITPQQYDVLAKYFKEVSCNIFQYKVEHFNTQSDLIVTAGAGSGKTHTLISRTLFLLNTGAVERIQDIAMITFTNEAADNMRIKLADRFMELFKQTGDEKYRTYLEGLQEMQISTIPAFAKQILQRFGQFIGLGSDVSISNLTMQRRELIDEHLDQALQATNKPELFGELPYFEIVKFIEQVWEKVEQKGVALDDFRAQFDGDELFQIVLTLLNRAEASFKQKKIDSNTVTLADLTRLLNDLVQTSVPLSRLQQQYRYLFIDEFQDTDNAQINFIVKIATEASIPLLVVGDSKQSIYRFRGANESAFKYLESQLRASGRQVAYSDLRFNYRTTHTLLTQMEALFTAWRQGNWLPSDEQPMQAKKMTTVYNDEQAFCVTTKELTSEEIVKKYNDIRALKKHDGSPVSMAILVRTNRDAQKVAKLLQQMDRRSKMVYDVQLEGTLFQSKAAKDLLILLDSWLYEEDKVALYALSETVFCRNYAAPKSVVERNGQYAMNADVQIELPQAWYDALEQLKYNPVMLVLNEFLAHVPYMENMAQHMEHFECTKYQLNLYKVLMLMYAALDEGTDLLAMYQWLSVQVTTNQSEDEATLEDADFDVPIVKVMTVHKSKGLEFHTVLIPYTRSLFIKREPIIKDGAIDYNAEPFEGDYPISKYVNVIVHANQQDMQLGWLYAVNRKNYTFDHWTANYASLKQDEDKKSAQEEARVLYVAMTRAEERCFIYNKQSSYVDTRNPKNWSDLLSMRGGRS